MTRQRDIRNAYTLTNSRGLVITTIYENERDSNSTSLVLHGRGAHHYGKERNENLVHLLENFANSTAPTKPLDGQFWWNTSDNTLYVWNEAGSPGAWQTVIPASTGIGFAVTAGNGLTGGGFPSGSPLTVTINVGEGNGITVSANAVSTNDSEIDHDSLSSFVANEHIDHSSITITAGDGLSGTDDITSNVTIDVNVGTGLQAQANALAVITGNDGVLITSGSQSIYGIKEFTSQIRGDVSGTSAAVPAYGFRNDADTIFQSGIYRSASNQLSFSTGAGTQALRIEANGVLRAIRSNYEAFVTNDDVIPNKKYVDDLAASAGIAPTINQHVGTSSISGLDGDQTYLVNVYGVLPSKGNDNFTLESIVLRRGSTTPGVGTFEAATPQVVINWPDGDMPTEAAFICEMDGDTSINCRINTGTEIRNSMLMTAVQLTNN